MIKGIIAISGYTKDLFDALLGSPHINHFPSLRGLYQFTKRAASSFTKQSITNNN